MNTPAANRQYDKGERRFKHVGKEDSPAIEFDRNSNPKKWVGKCPKGIPQTTLVELVNKAIPASNGDRDLDVPKRLYVVYKGAVYEAQTSDAGVTYHGYPYKGKLSKTLLECLKRMAEQENTTKDFESWVKTHIELHGERK